MLFNNFLFRESLLSVIEYSTGRELIRSDGHRIRSPNYCKKPLQTHHGVWRSVKTRNHPRLVDSQLFMRYFIWEYRGLKFEALIKKLDGAIKKIGKFEMIHVIIPIYQLLISSLAPSSHWEFSMSKLNVMRAPEMTSITGIWGFRFVS